MFYGVFEQKNLKTKNTNEKGVGLLHGLPNNRSFIRIRRQIPIEQNKPQFFSIHIFRIKYLKA